jgi:penicillin-binding protein 1C
MLKRYRYRYILALSFLVLISLYYFSLPQVLFTNPLSTTLYDKDHHLLGARIAVDGQWRFSQEGEIPEKYLQALITFEDQRFFRHPGFDLIAIVRALRDNIRMKKTVSGGSTISMQVISLSKGKKSANIPQKLIEIILSTRLEMRYKKKTILELYAANAPFGGNVVGLDAACWRFFQKDKSNISWAEAALLAVLPNNPALMHPGRNRDHLLQKRNRLLQKMMAKGIVDEEEGELAMQETLPNKPYPLPRLAPHLLDRIQSEFPGLKKTVGAWLSTLDISLQQRANIIAHKYHQVYIENQVHNLSILVGDITTGEVLAYVGNAPDTDKAFGKDVDIIRSPRSTGSLLKPFLYAWMLESGEILPDELLADIPVYMRDFRPENFNRTYDGAVQASKALSRSLNVPFALLLKQFGVDRFHQKLKRAGFSDLTKSSGHYGLSLILGGGECSLWDACQAFSLLAQKSMNIKNPVGLSYLKNAPIDWYPELFQPGAAFLTLQALTHLERPNSDGNWKRFNSGRKIAWKTGTSHGFRDAWAIGVDNKYVVGVWVGNAHGEGRPGIVGIEAAAPIMFEIFNGLPAQNWLSSPDKWLAQTDVCIQSGMLATKYCNSHTIKIPTSATQMKTCNYHQPVFLHKHTQKRAHADCIPSDSLEFVSWFVLPPIIANYYKKYNPIYISIPEWHTGCSSNNQFELPMQWIYPKPGMTITIPARQIEMEGQTVFKVAYNSPMAKLFWFMNEDHIGTTVEFHELAIRPEPGRHRFTCVNEAGQEIGQMVEIIWTQ